MTFDVTEPCRACRGAVVGGPVASSTVRAQSPDHAPDDEEDDERRRRAIPLLLIFLASLLGTGLIGWGGVAAWQAVTENSNNSAAAGSVHHQNTVVGTGSGGASVSCTDQTSPGSCSAIFSITEMLPGHIYTGGTVSITNIGQDAQSHFALSVTSAGAGALCPAVQIGIVDAETSPANVYGSAASPALLSGMTGSYSLKTAGSSPVNANSSTWATSDTDTYTFYLSLDPTSPLSDELADCSSIAFSWTQS